MEPRSTRASTRARTLSRGASDAEERVEADVIEDGDSSGSYSDGDDGSDWSDDDGWSYEEEDDSWEVGRDQSKVRVLVSSSSNRK